MAPAGRGSGVTLLELLVVMALVGLLAGLAYPTYRGYVLRAHRMEAIEALLAVGAAQERFHLEHGRFADGFEPDVIPGLAVESLTAGGRYLLRISQSTSGQFAATANPRQGSGQDHDDRCGEFGLDAAGRRWARDTAGNDSTKQCWG